MEKNQFSIWIGNVAKYTEGNLDGKWVDLPKSDEELQEIINGISNNGQDEVMIFDFDINENLAYLRDDISEYSSIEELNTLAQLLSLQEEHPAAELYISHAGNMTITEICNVLMQEDELPYMRYEFEGSDNPEVMRNMSDETKLGYTLLERDISLKTLLENREIGSSTLIHYINVEDIGRDMVMSGYAEVGEFGWYDTQAVQPELELYTVDDVKEHIQEMQIKEQKHQQRILDERVINKNGPKL